MRHREDYEAFLLYKMKIIYIMGKSFSTLENLFYPFTSHWKIGRSVFLEIDFGATKHALI